LHSGEDSYSGVSSEPDTRPNFLFLLADDQRADTIGAHGNQYIETPHLDRLVFRGFSFRSNYCLGSNSGAVCVPSRAMMHSGLAYHRIANDLEGVRTLPEILRGQGYTTFATGKWHNGQPSFLRSFSRAKKVFFGGMSDHTSVLIEDLSSGGILHNKRIGERFSSQLFADSVIDFLKDKSKDKPFYAYVSFTAPHDPRQPPESFRDHYYEERPPLPRNFLPQHPFDNGWLVVRDEKLAPWPRTLEVISDQLAEYYGLIIPTWTSRLAGSWRHRVRRTIPTLSTRRITAWPWGATACWANRVFMSTVCGHP